jgi:hypothetical protein
MQNPDQRKRQKIRVGGVPVPMAINTGAEDPAPFAGLAGKANHKNGRKMTGKKAFV